MKLLFSKKEIILRDKVLKYKLISCGTENHFLNQFYKKAKEYFYYFCIPIGESKAGF